MHSNEERKQLLVMLHWCLELRLEGTGHMWHIRERPRAYLLGELVSALRFLLHFPKRNVKLAGRASQAVRIGGAGGAAVVLCAWQPDGVARCRVCQLAECRGIKGAMP
jgi:hypothetical protein